MSKKQKELSEKHIEYGANWLKLKASLPVRLTGKCEYIVVDIPLEDEKYFLDRFFIRHKVQIEYPGGGDYTHSDYPNCVLYRIRFRKRDEEKVKEALEEMYRQSALMECGEGYLAGLVQLRQMLAA